jgi:hypothetical protein
MLLQFVAMFGGHVSLPKSSQKTFSISNFLLYLAQYEQKSNVVFSPLGTELQLQ